MGMQLPPIVNKILGIALVLLFVGVFIVILISGPMGWSKTYHGKAVLENDAGHGYMWVGGTDDGKFHGNLWDEMYFGQKKTIGVSCTFYFGLGNSIAFHAGNPDEHIDSVSFTPNHDDFNVTVTWTGVSLKAVQAG